MDLCHSLVYDPDDEKNRCPAGPFRSTDPYRCLRCGGWLDHGGLLDPAQFRFRIFEASSILKQLAEDYPFAHDLAHHPTRRPQNGRSGLVGDPTANDAADRSRARIRAYTLIVDRLVEDVVRRLRHADDACGSALYAAEPPGPADHTKAPYHDGSLRLVSDAAMDEAYAAQDRRRARGEAL